MSEAHLGEQYFRELARANHLEAENKRLREDNAELRRLSDGMMTDAGSGIAVDEYMKGEIKRLRKALLRLSGFPLLSPPRVPGWREMTDEQRMDYWLEEAQQ